MERECPSHFSCLILRDILLLSLASPFSQKLGLKSSVKSTATIDDGPRLCVARLFGPTIFEASKVKVLFLGAEKKHPGKYPRTYTLTHSDITSKLTLAISQTINNSQMESLANLDKSVSSSKSTKVSEGASSAKWNDYSNRVFIQLCVDEIGKGNRPNSHFNSNGWNNLVRKFNEMTGRSLVYKQIRNHWDAMKKEWLFKKLMYSETGIGWNPLKNSIDASEEWWSRKIKENVEYKKFKNKDLSLIWFEYDQLFCDVAATGERARAPSQRSRNEIDIENELLEVDGETNEVEERMEVGDSDDIGSIKVSEKYVGLESFETSSIAEKMMFPSLDSVKRKYCGEDSKKKKVSGAASLKEDIHSLLRFMGNKKSDSTPSTEITIKDAMEILNNVPGIAPMSELWNYACNLLSKKDMREVFASQPSHEARLSWLEFNYDLFKKNR